MVTNTTAATELVDDGEKRDARGRRLTPAARRAELVEAWRQSGLTRAAFARREGLKYPTFATWVQESRPGTRGRCAVRPNGRRREAPVRFAEVSLPLAAPTLPLAAIEVRLPDGTVVRGAQGCEVAAVVRALRG